MGRLDGKVAIITGAGSGIGRSGAILFAMEDAKVVVADISTDGGEATVKIIKERGRKATFVNANVSKTEDVKNMIKIAVNTYGKLDILWNNAAILGELSSTVDYSEEIWDKVLQVNLKGVWLVMKYAIPEMLKSGGGSIINSTSTITERGIPKCAAYTAAKGGVLSLSRETAIEYAKQNIRVNCICPGTTETTMLATMPEESKRHLLQGIPVGRFGKPEEIAYGALFLASDEAPFMTGQVLAIDGGIITDGHQGI